MPEAMAFVLGWCGVTFVVSLTVLFVSLTWMALKAMFWD